MVSVGESVPLCWVWLCSNKTLFIRAEAAACHPVLKAEQRPCCGEKEKAFFYASEKSSSFRFTSHFFFLNKTFWFKEFAPPRELWGMLSEGDPVVTRWEAGKHHRRPFPTQRMLRHPHVICKSRLLTFLSHWDGGHCVHFLFLASTAYSCQEGLCLVGDGGVEVNVPGVRVETGPLVTVVGTQ